MARGRFLFWLDFDKDDELLLAETIDDLKSRRLFVRTVRDGIRLICDLRKGRIDVLFELFPWVKAEFLAGLMPPETPGERALRAHLERIEEQLLEQGRAPKALGNGGPRQMDVPQFDLPYLDDDDEETVLIERDTSTNSAQNFIDSMLNLQ